MHQIESFFWGIIAALGALVIELLIFIGFSAFSSSATELSFAQLFIVPQFIIISVLVEEIFKYLIISKRVELFSMKKSYIINSLLVGLGFFSVELGLIITTGVIPETKILSEIALIHIGTAGLIGYIVAIKNPAKLGTLIYAMLVTIFFHGSYNFLVLQRTFVINYLIFILLGLLILLNLINIVRINKKLAQG